MFYSVSTIRKRAKEINLRIQKNGCRYSLLSNDGDILCSEDTIDQVESVLISEYEGITGKRY